MVDKNLTEQKHLDFLLGDFEQVNKLPPGFRGDQANSMLDNNIAQAYLALKDFMQRYVIATSTRDKYMLCLVDKRDEFYASLRTSPEKL